MDQRPAGYYERSAPGRALLAVAVFAAILIGTRGITSEAAVSLQGDMARYLMNGVFLLDLCRPGHGWSWSSLLTFAQDYYARYPALSLGHHPPLLPAALVPFFATFGVSVASARLAILTFFVASVLLLFALVRRVYDEATAGWACVLFATNPFIGWFGQRVLSELPAIALVLGAMNFTVRFRYAGRARDYLCLVGTATLSLAARQLSIFMFPAYAVLLLWGTGWRRLTSPRVLSWTLAALVLLGVAGICTIVLSPFNVGVVRAILHSGPSLTVAWEACRVIAREQIGWPLLAASVVGVVWSAILTDRRIGWFAVWIVAVLAGVVFVTGLVEPARYSILAVPAYCVCGAAVFPVARGSAGRTMAALGLVVCFVWQFAHVGDPRPTGATGYEDAARYVLEQGNSPTVMFSGPVDTGYFVFFVRKHDPQRRLVVLRSDKMLTTSLMGDVAVEDRVSTPAEIEGVLRRFGTRYVVIEDRTTDSHVLNWLRNELHSPQFAERRRFPSRSLDRRLRDVDIAVYEYLGATPPAPDAQLDLHLPLVNREIRVPLADLSRRPRLTP